MQIRIRPQFSGQSCFCQWYLLCTSDGWILCPCRSGVSTEKIIYIRQVSRFNKKDICVTLEDSEAEKVIDILNGNNYATVSSGVPSCGFDKNISLNVGDRIFPIACDTCNCIQDLGNLRYFDISQEDMEYIHSLFEKYGGYFPCI